MITRRDFTLTALKGATLTLLVPSMLMEEGCAVNAKALLNTAIDSALAILKVADSNAQWLPSLSNAIAALQAAEAKWSNGSTVDIVLSAIDTLQAVLAVIPQTSIYSPLIAILVAALSAVISAMKPTAQTQRLSAHLDWNPYKGQAKLRKPHLLQSAQGAYKAQWNNTAKRIGLPKAEI